MKKIFLVTLLALGGCAFSFDDRRVYPYTPSRGKYADCISWCQQQAAAVYGECVVQCKW